MAAQKTYHVVSDPHGGWNVLKGGAERASKHFDDRNAAIAWGSELSRSQRTEFVVHRSDGTVESTKTYGGDPRPPREHGTGG